VPEPVSSPGATRAKRGMIWRFRVPPAQLAPALTSQIGESGRGDLNPRPQRPERCALTKLRYFPLSQPNGTQPDDLRPGRATR
jgi:hypothetical protein